MKCPDCNHKMETIYETVDWKFRKQSRYVTAYRCHNPKCLVIEKRRKRGKKTEIIRAAAL